MGGGGPVSPAGGQNQNVDVRTMASDLNSVGSGSVPQSYAPAASGPAPQAPAQKSESTDFQIPGPAMDTSGTQEGLPPGGVPKPKKGKGMMVGVVVFLVVIALAAIGYFLVYPMFGGTKAPTVATNPPATNTPANNNALPPIGGNATPPVPTSTNETSSPTTTPAPIVHSSLFQTTDASINSPVIVSSINLKTVDLTTTKTPALVEVVPQDQNGNPIAFSDIMKSLISMDLTQSGLNQAFDPAYTAEFAYVDAQGNRSLGLVAKLSATSSLVDEKATFGQIFEANTNLKNFWGEDPGTEGAWKSGDATTFNRYVLFSKNGYGLDYGWKNDVLVISSSYDGYKLAVQSLQ